MIEHPHETRRLLDLAEKIEGETLAAWLGVRVNPYSWNDPKYEPAQVEIERQWAVAGAREKKT